MCVDRRRLMTEETVTVNIIRDKYSYSFVVKETAEWLCDINIVSRQTTPYALRLLDELWRHTGSGGFRPVGDALADHRTIKTIAATPQQVESLRSLAKAAHPL